MPPVIATAALLATAAGLLPGIKDPLSTPEFSPTCNECVHLLTFNAEGQDIYFEVYLSDATHADGKRLVYKGPSGETFLTVAGSPTASIRTCGRYYSCSNFVESILAPQHQSNMPETERSFRLTDPVELVHFSGSPVEAPNVSATIRNPVSVSLDLSATGQFGCERGIGKRRWNIGGRMKLSVSPETSFIVRNKSVVEHGDGYWTWSGEIENGGSGTVELTAEDCKGIAFVSIDSDHGHFAIRPGQQSSHVIYEVTAYSNSADCAAAIEEPGPSLLSITEVERPADWPDTSRSNQRDRAVSIDYSALDAIWSDFVIVAGPDRRHPAADFVVSRGRLEVAPGVELAVDLGAGELQPHYRTVARGTGELTLQPKPVFAWTGCVPGIRDAMVSITLGDGAFNHEAHNLVEVSGVQYLISRHQAGDIYRLLERLQ